MKLFRVSVVGKPGFYVRALGFFGATNSACTILGIPGPGESDAWLMEETFSDTEETFVIFPGSVRSGHPNVQVILENS
jgi:hypothetical protein